jgi:ParB-like chromosome segregation protein Spo0J
MTMTTHNNILIQLFPDKLLIDPARNSRSTPEIGDGSLATLVAGIEAGGGNTVPVLAYFDDDTSSYVLYDGFRRARAVQTINEKRAFDGGEPLALQVLVTDRPVDDAAIYTACIEVNANRKDMTAMEVVQAVAKLEGFGKTRAEVATALGLSEAMVSTYARIPRLPKDVQEMLETGALTLRDCAELVTMLPKKGELKKSGDAVARVQAAHEQIRATAAGIVADAFRGDDVEDEPGAAAVAPFGAVRNTVTGESGKGESETSRFGVTDQSNKGVKAQDLPDVYRKSRKIVKELIDWKKGIKDKETPEYAMCLAVMSLFSSDGSAAKLAQKTRRLLKLADAAEVKAAA